MIIKKRSIQICSIVIPIGKLDIGFEYLSIGI